MASEKLFRVPTKPIRTVSAPPAVLRPFLSSQGGHRFSVLGRHLETKTALVATRGCQFMSRVDFRCMIKAI